MRELKAHEQILAIFRENNILHYLSTHNYIAPDLENAVHPTPLAADVEAMKAGAHDVVSLKHDEGGSSRGSDFKPSGGNVRGT